MVIVYALNIAPLGNGVLTPAFRLLEYESNLRCVCNVSCFYNRIPDRIVVSSGGDSGVVLHCNKERSDLLSRP